MMVPVIADFRALTEALARGSSPAPAAAVEGRLVRYPQSWTKQATLSTATIPAVNHLPPAPLKKKKKTLPLSQSFSPSLRPALICKCRLIRAWGPWWNFAVIVPNFSNIFYCLHHSFRGGRRGERLCQLCKWCCTLLQITSFGCHCLWEFNY